MTTASVKTPGGGAVVMTDASSSSSTSARARVPKALPGADDAIAQQPVALGHALSGNRYTSPKPSPWSTKRQPPACSIASVETAAPRPWRAGGPRDGHRVVAVGGDRARR